MTKQKQTELARRCKILQIIADNLEIPAMVSSLYLLSKLIEKKHPISEGKITEFENSIIDIFDDKVPDIPLELISDLCRN